jgi:hypothetical protein
MNALVGLEVVHQAAIAETFVQLPMQRFHGG